MEPLVQQLGNLDQQIVQLGTKLADLNTAIGAAKEAQDTANRELGTFNTRMLWVTIVILAFTVVAATPIVINGLVWVGSFLLK